MTESNTEHFLQELTQVARLLAEGEYGKADALFKFTGKSACPAKIAELAESFGMMLVKIEAREFDLQKKIEELDRIRVELEQSRNLLARENSVLRKTVKASFSPENIIGKGKEMQEALRQAARLADMPVNVLVTGETGTGKELIAKMLHYNGVRNRNPFVALNCTAIPDELFESELFGIEKGVASGVEGRQGRIEQAHGGTLFLDEIGDMPLVSQSKILRVLEERTLVRVGGRKEIPVDIRIVAATHKDLKKEVKEKRFRQDLYFRIKVVNLHLPPLRERKDDIPLLAALFLNSSCRKFGRPTLAYAPETIQHLQQYNWPGNVRELENEVERLAVLTMEDTVYPHDLSREIQSAGPGAVIGDDDSFQADTLNLQEVERRTIERALRCTNANRTKTAASLGISREGLRKKMQRYNLE